MFWCGYAEFVLCHFERPTGAKNPSAPGGDELISGKTGRFQAISTILRLKFARNPTDKIIPAGISRYRSK
jgi:hypothetical protein